MIRIPMTPAQFARAKDVVSAPGGEVVSFSESGPASGSFATAQVGMSYSYDGSALQLVVTAKHGLAKFASEDVIKGKLLALLGQL